MVKKIFPAAIMPTSTRSKSSEANSEEEVSADDQQQPRVLWVGGTSGLARTFVEELPLTRRLLLAAPSAPKWKLPLVYNAAEIRRLEASVKQIDFAPLDLTSQESVEELLKRHVSGSDDIDTLILGARASLVWANEEHMKLVANLERLLNLCIDAGVKVSGLTR